VRQPQQDDKPNAAGLADEIALQDKADFSNAEWELIVSALRALAYPPSAEGSTDIKLSDRIRPNSEAAPWVIEEIRKLERRCAKSHGGTVIVPSDYKLVRADVLAWLHGEAPLNEQGFERPIGEGAYWWRKVLRLGTLELHPTDSGNARSSDIGEIGT
jgi:hypothetical protein